MGVTNEMSFVTILSSLPPPSIAHAHVHAYNPAFSPWWQPQATSPLSFRADGGIKKPGVAKVMP